MMTTGLIGLGDMGGPIAHRMLDGGIDLVVYDIRVDGTAPLTQRGAGSATDGPALAKQCDVIFVCVVNDEQVLAVADSVRESVRSGSVLVIISSVLPATVLSVAAMLEPRGVAVVDAPVTGSRPAAAAGTLTVMVGGDGAVVASITPVLETFARKIVHVGSVGMAQAVKIANNVMLHMNHLIALEAVQFARAHGVSEETLVEVVNAGTGRSWVTETWGLIDGMFIDHPQAGTDGIYDMMVKEMWNAVLLGKAAHVGLPLTSLGVQVSRAMLERRTEDLAAKAG